MLTTRSSVEKQLADIDSIKVLLEEIAAAELATAATATQEVEEVKVTEEEEKEEVIDSSAEEIAAYKTEIDEV